VAIPAEESTVGSIIERCNEIRPRKQGGSVVGLYDVANGAELNIKEPAIHIGSAHVFACIYSGSAPSVAEVFAEVSEEGTIVQAKALYTKGLSDLDGGLVDEATDSFYATVSVLRKQSKLYSGVIERTLAAVGAAIHQKSAGKKKDSSPSAKPEEVKKDPPTDNNSPASSGSPADIIQDTTVPTKGVDNDDDDDDAKGGATGSTSTAHESNIGKQTEKDEDQSEESAEVESEEADKELISKQKKRSQWGSSPAALGDIAGLAETPPTEHGRTISGRILLQSEDDHALLLRDDGSAAARSVCVGGVAAHVLCYTNVTPEDDHENGKGFITFVIAVRIGPPPAPSWIVRRRYSEFYKLSGTLDKNGDSRKIEAKLPRKILFSPTQSDLQGRLKGLDSFLKKSMGAGISVASQDALDKFLDLDLHQEHTQEYTI
jgi:hypothetical protein